MSRKPSASKEESEMGQLELFLKFVNEDINALAESEFLGLSYTYASFLCWDPKYTLLNLRQRHDAYTGDLLDRPSAETLKERKAFFREIQTHLRSKVEAVIEAANSSLQEPRTVVEMTGMRRLSIDPGGNSFSDTFWPEGLQLVGRLDPEKEKALAELTFMDMIQEANLEPSRFRKCEWEKCEKFLYQRTEKKRRFCSVSCSNAARQARKRKEDKRKAGKA
jgi:hypothetical protein